MGGVTIPVQTPTPYRPEQPDPLGQQAKAQQVVSGQQGLQSQQLQMQMQRQQLKDQQAITDAAKNWNGQDYDSLAKSVLQNGGSGNAAFSIQQHGLAIKKQISDIAASDATTGSKNLETFLGKQKAIGDALQGIEQVPDDQLHSAVIDKVATLTKGGVLDPQTAQQIAQGVQKVQDPQQLRSQIDLFAKTSMGAQALAAQQKTAADTQQAQAKAALDKANTVLSQNKADIIKNYQQNPTSLESQIDAITPKNTALNSRTKFMVRQSLQAGDIDGAKDAIKQAAQQVGAIEKESYTQAAENVRQSLNRQAMQSNELQKNGLNQLDKMFTDPTHGYTQFLAQAQSTKNTLEDAKNGSQLAASMAPLMTALGVTSFAGIHRINQTEVNSAGPQVGSIYRHINTILDKAGSGSLPPDTAKEMNQLIDGLITAKHQGLVQGASMVAANAGLDPKKTSVMDRTGKMTTLDQVVGAPGETAPAQAAPSNDFFSKFGGKPR